MISTTPTLKTFTNRYGTLTVEVVTDYLPVKRWRCANLPDEHKFYGLDIGEKIALITESERTQLVYQYPFTENLAGFLLHHDTGSTAAVCRVVSVDYRGGLSAREEIMRSARASL
jgi:hypothetical protein